MAALLARHDRTDPAPALGGYAALAEGSWMGQAQASDVLEAARTGNVRGEEAPRGVVRRRLGALFTRELTVAEATAVLMTSFLASALLGAVRQVLFNAQFGAGAEATAYYAAFRLPDTLFSLIAGGALSSAMIPVLAASVREDGSEAGTRLTRLVLTTLLAAFAVVVVAGELFAPLFVSRVLAPGFDAPMQRLTINLTRVMLLQPLILAVGSVATAVLNSRSQFGLTAMSVASHNVGLIGGIVASMAYPQLGIYGPTLGVLAGAVLQALIVLPGLVGGGDFRLTWDPSDRRLRELVGLLIPNGLAVGVGYAGFILDTAFASKAPEAAGLAALHNAWMMVGLPIALLGQAVGQAAFPRLAAQAASLEWQRVRRTVLIALASVAALSIPALLGLLVLGRLAIRVLFQHGRFDAGAGALTYSVLVPYAVALPAYVATEVLVRGLIALRDTRTPLLTNSAQLACRAALMAVLLVPLGVVAIPVAFASAAVLETIALACVLFVKLRQGPSPAR